MRRRINAIVSMMHPEMTEYALRSIDWQHLVR